MKYEYGRLFRMDTGIRTWVTDWKFETKHTPPEKIRGVEREDGLLNALNVLGERGWELASKISSVDEYILKRATS